MPSTTSKAIDCSIIIVNYNTSQLIVDLLQTIRQYCVKHQYEIIVVDNASPNDNLHKLQTEYPEVSLIENKKNEGFGKANNIGISQSKGAHLLLLNSDTLFQDNALDKCIDFMQSSFAKENNIGLMACQLLNADLSHQPSTFGEFSLPKYLIYSNLLLNRLVRRNNKSKSKKSQFVAAVSGAFMLFKKEVFEKVKPFDPDIFMYSEETELCRERVGKHFKIYYWVDASVIHLGGGSSSNKMQLQEMVSYSLTWYKKGISMYLIHIFTLTINYLTALLILPIMKPDNRNKTINQLKKIPKHYYYLFFKIPRYSRHWGARSTPLKAL